MVAMLIKAMMASMEEELGGGSEDPPEETGETLDTESKDYQRIAGEMNLIRDSETLALNQVSQATGMSMVASQCRLDAAVEEMFVLLAIQLCALSFDQV